MGSDFNIDRPVSTELSQRPAEQPLLRSISDFGFRSNRPEIVARRLLYDSRPKPPSNRQRTISLNRTIILNRTISLNQNLVNTEREPILLNEKSNKTIFVQGKIKA